MRKSFVLILILTTCHLIGHAQLATYSFSGTGTCSPTQGNSSITFSNGTTSAFSRVGSLGCTSASNYFTTNGWAISSTIDNSQYIEFVVTANTGYKLDLTSLGFTFKKSSTGPSSMQIAHNGTGTFNTYSSVFTPTTSDVTTSFAFSSFSSSPGGSVTFRIYGWGLSPTTAAGTMSFTNVTVNGSVSPSSPFTIDYLNEKVGLGTAPTYKFDIGYTDNNFNGGLNIQNTSNGVQAITGVTFKDNSAAITGSLFSTNSNYANTAQANSFITSSAGLKRLGIISNVNSVSNTPQDIYFSTLGNNSNYQMFIKGSTGHVGIGTKTPAGKLHVKGNSEQDNDGNWTTTAVFEGTNPGMWFLNSNGSNDFQMGLASGAGAFNRFAQSGDFILGKANTFGHLFIANPEGGNIVFTTGPTGYASESKAMVIYNNGSVGIGTNNLTSTEYKLYVEKGIRTRKVKVDIDTWADYVFAPSFKLMPLQDLETYIKTHQHLPDVPTTDEVIKDGIDLGSNQALLLKKVEELTLYLIEQNKKIQQLEVELKSLKKGNLSTVNK